MKSFQIPSLAITALLALSLFFGCARETGHSHEEGHDNAQEEGAEGVTYHESKGLHVPKTTGDFIGLKIVDVGEEQMHSTVAFSAKVYRLAQKDLAVESKRASASGNLSKADAERLRIGEKVEVQSGTEKFTGKISALNPAAIQANGQFEVLLEIEDSQHVLTIGSRVTVIIPKGEAETVTAVPRSALLKTAEGNFVYTVSGDHLVRTEVKVGKANENAVEIKDGLYAGDQVAANPVMTLWMAELQSIRGGAACADGH